MFKTSEFFEKLYVRNGKKAKGITYLGTKTDTSMINRPFPIAKINEIDNFCNEFAINRYFTPNSFTIDSKEKTKENVISLNTFFIDIDYKKQGLTLDYVLSEVKKRTKIPFSAIVSSGNGLHLYYFIDFVYIPRRTQNTSTIINLYESTMTDLIKIFMDLGADNGAKSINNYLRLPNTVNVKENQGVNSVDILELNDNVYDLSTVAILYKKGYADYINDPLKQAKHQQNKQNNNNKKAKKVSVDLANDRVNDLISLINMRNGRVKNRNDFLRLCLFFNSSRIFELNSHFVNQEKDTVLNSMLKYHNKQKAKNDFKLNKKMLWTNTKIIEILEISEIEQKQLKTIISKAESKTRDKLRKRKNREIPQKIRKITKEFQVFYVSKFENLMNKQLASDLNISIDTIKRIKKKEVNIFKLNSDLREVLAKATKQSKVVNRILETKNIEDMTKTELKKVYTFLSSVA